MRNRAIFALLLLAACHKAPQHSFVSKAWVRLAAVPGQPGAAYFDLVGGRHAARLVKVESAMAKRAELHESMKGMDGPSTGSGQPMATMKPLDGISVFPGTHVAFAPGGRHVMLFGIDPQVKPGTAIPLRFGFADGSTAEAEAKTVAAGDDAPY